MMQQGSAHLYEEVILTTSGLCISNDHLRKQKYDQRGTGRSDNIQLQKK